MWNTFQSLTFDNTQTISLWRLLKSSRRSINVLINVQYGLEGGKNNMSVQIGQLVAGWDSCGFNQVRAGPSSSKEW